MPGGKTDMTEMTRCPPARPTPCSSSGARPASTAARSSRHPDLLAEDGQADGDGGGFSHHPAREGQWPEMAEREQATSCYRTQIAPKALIKETLHRRATKDSHPIFASVVRRNSSMLSQHFSCKGRKHRQQLIGFSHGILIVQDEILWIPQPCSSWCCCWVWC